jgi:hypothetical protein
MAAQGVRFGERLAGSYVNFYLANSTGGRAAARFAARSVTRCAR